MKEYINRLARGKFTYQRPELEVQDYTLTGSVTAGGATLTENVDYTVDLRHHSRLTALYYPVMHVSALKNPSLARHRQR